MSNRPIFYSDDQRYACADVEGKLTPMRATGDMTEPKMEFWAGSEGSDWREHRVRNEDDFLKLLREFGGVAVVTTREMPLCESMGNCPDELRARRPDGGCQGCRFNV